MMGIIVRGQSFITEAPRKGRENAMLQVNVMHESMMSKTQLFVHKLF